MTNPEATSRLTSANYTTRLAAYLQDETGKNYYVFQYNPEKKEHEKSAVYNEAIIPGTTVQQKVWSHTQGEKLVLPSLLLESHAQRKSLKVILEELKAMLKPNPANAKKAPYRLYFVWGSTRFGPAILTSMKWVEDGWLSGEPAVLRMDLVLEEVPAIAGVPAAANPATVEATTANTTQPLSQRQIEEGNAKAEEFIRQNLNHYAEPLRSTLRARRYSLSTTPDGSVRILGTNGVQIDVAGSYDGQQFIPQIQPVVTTR